MGNVKSTDFVETDVEDDAAFLKLKSSAFLNDNFISNTSQKLPSFGFPEQKDDTKSDAEGEGESDEHALRMQNLLAVLTTDPEAKSLKVEEYETLGLGSALSKSAFHVITDRRSRVLLRVLQAYSKVFKEYKASQSDESGKSSKQWKVQPVVDEIRRVDAISDSGNDKDVLISMSIMMTLSLAKSLAKSADSGMLQGMLSTMVEILSSFSPLSLASSNSKDKQLHAVLTGILGFAEELLSHSEASVRSLAVSLQLLMGLLTGSVSRLAEVAQKLLAADSDGQSIQLHPAAASMLRTCMKIQPSFDLAFPNHNYINDKFNMVQEMSSNQINVLKGNPTLLSIGVSPENSCVYIYNGVTGSVQKVGTGHGDNVAGEVLQMSKTIWSDVEKLKSIDGEEKKGQEEVKGKLTVLGTRVYLRLESLLSPYELAVLNADSLVVEEIVDLKPVFSELLEREFSQEMKSEGEETFVVDLSVTNSIVLQAAKHHTIQVSAALVDGLTDVAVLLRKHLSSNFTCLAVDDIIGLIKTYYADNHINSSLQPLTLTISVKSKIDVVEYSKVPLSIGSDHNSLILIYDVSLPKKVAGKVKSVFNLAEAVEFTSVSLRKAGGASEEGANDAAIDVLDHFKSLWSSVMLSIANGTYAAEIQAQHFEEIMNGATGMQIVVEYTVLDVAQCLVFTQECLWLKLYENVVSALGVAMTHLGNRQLLLHVASENGNYKVLKHSELSQSTGSNSDILTNTYQYVFMSFGKTDSGNEEAIVSGHKYEACDMRHTYSQYRFIKNVALPSSFAYDINSNAVYGIDVFTQSIVKWSNPGFAPIMLSATNKSHPLNMSPCERLSYFTQMSTPNYGLAILTMLEALSEPFGCSFHSIINDSYRVNDIKIVTKQDTSTSTPTLKSSFLLNNIPIVFDDEIDGECSGYHLVVLDANYHLYKKIMFDNENSDAAAERLAEFIDALPKDYIVCIANVDCIHDNMMRSTYEALTRIGLVDLETLCVDENKDSQLVCIGRKGLPVGQAELFTAKSNQSLSVHRVFPPRKIPLAIEGNDLGAIGKLVRLATASYKSLSNNAASNDLALVQLCSMLRVLQVSVYHLVTQSDVHKIIPLLGDEITALKTMMFDLFHADYSHLVYMQEAIQTLFMASFDLIYSDKADQVQLLKLYAESFVAGTITVTEESLLLILLKRYADPSNILSMSDGEISYQTAVSIFNVTAQIITVLQNQKDGAIGRRGRIYSSAVSLLFSLSKLLLAADSDAIFLASGKKEASKGELTIDVLNRLSSFALSILSQAVEDAKSHQGDSAYLLELLNKLKGSPLGSSLPLAVACLSGISTKGSYDLVSKSMESMMGAIDVMLQCASCMDQLLALLPSECKEYDNKLSKKQMVDVIFESDHPYRSNMDETTVISFPGALSVVITFDPQCRTEHECDYIMFRDNGDNVLHEGRFSGRDGNENFPGSGGRPPLVVPFSEFKCLFHSDGSVEDWGYKFTAQAVYPPKLNQVNRNNWLLKFSFDIVQALCSVGKVLINGPEKKVELEDKFAHYMENSLVKPDLFLFREHNLSPEDQFLSDLSDRKEGTHAEKFLSIMKRKVIEDRGAVEDINFAVYASCAAILKANNLVKEALAVANGTRADVSPALCKAWKAAQKMRSYFYLKDVVGTTDNNDAGNSGEKSLYSGADQDVIRKASQSVIERAKFLLRSPVSLADGKEESPVDSQGADKAPHLSPYSLAGISSPLSPKHPLVSGNSGDRWKLAAKAVSLQRQYSDDTKRVATMWHSLVDEVVVIDKLKNMLLHRRKFAERSRQGKQLTTTEKVLQFIQSDADIGKLQEINSIRNKRAIIRAKGIDIFSKVVGVESFPFAIFIASSNFYQALQANKKEDGTTHYGNDLDGCSPEQQMLLCQKFSQFLKKNVDVLNGAVRRVETESEISVQWRLALMSTLSACAFDFEYSDHAIVFESGLADAVETILKSTSDHEVSSKCRSLLEIMVKNFFVLDSVHDTPSEPTDMGKKLVQVISSLLAYSVGSDISTPKLLESSMDEKRKAVVSCPANFEGDGFNVSYVVPSCNMEAEHSFDFNLYRPKSKLIDGVVDVTSIGGRMVMRGFNWKDDPKRSDGGFGKLGEISSYNAETKIAKVKWPKKKTGEYELRDDVSQSELSFADPQVGGYLFSRGDVSLLNAVVPATRQLPFVTALHAILLPDASLLFVYFLYGADPVFLRSKTRIQPLEWVRISLTCDASLTCKLFLNGVLDNSVQLAPVSFLQKSEITIESEHPVIKQVTVSTPYAMENADYMVVRTDERTSVLPSQGKAAFVVERDGEAHEEYPLTNISNDEDKHAFIVPGGNVVFKYESLDCEEQQGENWGYKFYVSGVGEAVINELVQFSVRSPVYIGHPPAFISSPVVSIAHGFSGVLSNFSIRGSFEKPVSRTSVSKATDDISALSLFGIIRKAVEDMESLSDTSLRRSFANTGLLDSLFELMAYGSNVVRCAAYHVAAYVLPVMDVELVDGLAARHRLTDKTCSSFAEYLINSAGQAMSFWSSSSPHAYVPESANDTMGILSSQVKLLRAMACGREEWYASIKSIVSKILQTAPALLSDLEGKIAKEMQSGTSGDVELNGKDDSCSISLLFGLMALLGYDAAGIYAGAAVIFTDPESGIDEEGIVIGFSRPVAVKETTGKEKDKDKDQQQKLAKLWDSISSSHGEAVCVSLFSQPQTPTVLPRKLLRLTSSMSLPGKFKDFLAESIGLEKIVDLVDRIAHADLMDYRPKPVPIVHTEKKELFFESEHPYADNLDTCELIEIPGAKSLTIEFDENTLTESNCDYVQFFKDKSKSESYGTKYSGRNGDENFPGYGGRPALVIPASSCAVHFHSDASNNDWGYKFKVSATISNITEPPNMPYLAHYSLLAQLKMCSLKAFQRLLSTFDTESQPVFFNALDKLVSCVLLPRPVSYVRQPLDGSKMDLIFESSHPYEDNQDQYIPVHIPKAKKMTITFDPETRTECNCDYIVLYTDESRQSRVPDSEQYTGGKDGSNSNWPGIGGKEPLVIEGDSFVIHFHSDGSVNDWGWKMYVSADVAGGSFDQGSVVTRGHDIVTAANAENCCITLRNYALDGVVQADALQHDQRMASFVLEKAPAVNAFYVDTGSFELNASSPPGEESKEEKVLEECKVADPDSMMTGANLTVKRVNELGRQDKIITTSAVEMYDAPNGTVKGSLEKDSACSVIENQGKWLKVKSLDASESPQEEFWISAEDNDAAPFIFLRQFVELAQPPSETSSLGKPKESQTGKPKKKVANPVYSVEESAAGAKPKVDISPLPAHVSLLRQDGQSVNTAISDYAVIASILYATECVSELIKHWPKGKPFTAKQFGSINGLLTYLNMHATNMQNPDSRSLVEAVVDLLLGDETETSLPLALSSFAFKSLAHSSSANVNKSVDSYLVKRGEYQDFESMHPYDHNMDQDWKFSFPGAKRLEIAFDSKCATETNYDHITIYDYSKSNSLYPSKITGYAAASDRHWPGVNVPRVVLEGVDKCVVNFKSDGGTNDWGFKGTVFAIFEEPESVQNKSTVEKDLPIESKDYSKLCIWIIYLLAARPNLSSTIKQSLYTVENFRSLCDYFTRADGETKTTLIDIFIVFSKELVDSCSDLQALKDQLMVFEQTMTAYAQELYVNDTNTGADLNMVSPNLQAVAQLLVSIDSVAFSIRHKCTGSRSDENDELVLIDVAAPSTDNFRFMLQRYAAKNKTSLFRWDAKVEALLDANSITVGLVLDCQPFISSRTSTIGANSGAGLEIGYNNKKLFVCLNEVTKVVPYGVEAKDLEAGDILSVLYNSTQGVVSFLINDVSLGVAVGTPLHYASVEMDIRKLNLTFAVSMSSTTDRVVARPSQKFDVASSGNLGGSAGNILEWLSPLYDVNSILTSVWRQQVPPVILGNKLLPYCNKKHKQTFSVSKDELKACQLFEKDVMFTSVQSVNLLIHELKLHPKDKFQVLDVNGKVLMDLKTTNEWKFSAPLDALLLTTTSKSFDDRGTRLSGNKGKGLSSGDRVHRGADWCYGMQDGGIGNYGTVTKVVDWKGESNKGAIVKWDSNDQEARYRYDYFGAYDIKLVSGGSSQQDKLSAQGLWSTPESILKLRVTLHAAEEGEEEIDRTMNVTFFPCYKLEYCMQEPAFESFRNRLESLFVCRNRSGLTALVQYVNNFGKSKDLPRDDLLNKKYDDLIPSKDDLTKSRALKDLFEATALVMDESDIEAFNYDVVAALDMFITEDEVVEAVDTEPNFVFTGPHVDFKLEGMAEWGGMNEFDSEENARLASQQVYPKCRGFTKTGGSENSFSLRVGTELIPSPGDISWILVDKNEKKSRITLSREQSADRPISVENVSINFAAEGDNTEEIEGGVGEEVWEDVPESDGGENVEDEANDDEEGEDGEDEEDEEDGSDEEDDDEEMQFESESDGDEDSGSDNDSESGTQIDSVGSSAAAAAVSSPQRTSSATPSCRKCKKLCRKHPSNTWQNGWSCDWPQHEGQNRFSSDDVVYGCDTIGPCNWGICQKCWDKIHSAGAADISQVTKQLLTAEASPIASQYIIIQLLNVALVKSLPFIDLTKANQHPSSLATLVSQNRDLILEVVKSSPFQDTLSQTMGSGSSFELRLSRVKAKRQSNNHKVDTEGRWSVFAQAFRVLHFMSPKTLRRTDRLYSTKFLGEHAQDAGGPYRESFDTYCQELQSATLPLLLRTPNGRHAVGYNREKYILNPHATSTTQLAMLSFLGKLMGIAIRSKEYLALNIAPFVWKLIAGATVTKEDLEGIDFSQVKSLDMLGSIETTGITAETFSTVFFETFTTVSSGDRIVPLVPNGDQIDVTFENCKQYVDLVLQYRLHEFDKQAAAVREGLSTMVPLQLLRLYTAEELEELVCGKAEIDVDLLQSIAEYSSCASSDSHVQQFWEIMRSFSNEERSAFVRFTWGRTRLPLNAAGFSQRFKIQSFNRSPADRYFPVSHTCFFSVELPRYSSAEIMREKLLYAIFNCEAIDGDEAGAAATMGWEEEEDEA